MRKALSALVAAALVVAIGAKIATDPEVQKRVNPVTPRPTATATAMIVVPATPNANVSTPAISPPYAAAYAMNFCAADAHSVAAATSMSNITEADIVSYFANDPVVCSGIRYLGAINDGGAERHVFVLSYDAGREDYVVFTFDAAHKATGLKRG